MAPFSGLWTARGGVEQDVCTRQGGAMPHPIIDGAPVAPPASRVIVKTLGKPLISTEIRHAIGAAKCYNFTLLKLPLGSLRESLIAGLLRAP